MRDPKLAFHRWRMGQVLMPAHFRAQEEALLDHVGLRFHLSGLPWYGLARLDWDPALLSKGVLSIERCTAIFISGELLDVGGNAVISNLNFADLAVDERVTVYLHLLADDLATQELERYRGDDADVERVVHRLLLSVEAFVENARESMKLADFYQDADGVWQLDRFVPPLVQLGGGVTPFLLDVIRAREAALAELDTRIAAYAADAFLGGERTAQLGRIRGAAYRLRALLADYGHQIALHPYILFVALRDFYSEACMFQGLNPRWPAPHYDHDALADCFAEINALIDDVLQVTPLSSPRLGFLRQGGRMVAEPFPDDLVEAREVYLLVQTTGLEEVSFDGVKLASPSRIETVHINALAGVPWHRIESVPFSHTFGHRASFFALQRNDEWMQAVRERALCFIARPYLEQAKFALTWRT